MELKANELRINNYVLDIDGDVLSISEITKDYVSFNKCNLKSRYSKIKPIHLTEEWLLKFGFGKSDEHELGHNLNDNFGFYYDYHFKRFRLETSDNDGLNYADVLLNIKHVHQLQNLYFALTNKELEIKM